MPALKLFGKRTMVAGDDLRTTAIAIFLFRMTQFALAVPVLISLIGGAATEDWQDVVEFCRDTGKLNWSEANSALIMHLFISFSLTMSTTGMLMAIGIYIYSGKGTPTDAQPRKPILYFCYLHLTFYHILRALSFSFGIVSTNDLDEYCNCVRAYNLRFADMDPADDEDGILIRDLCEHKAAWLTCYVALIVTHWMDVVYAVVTLVYFSRKYIPDTHQTVVTPDRTCKWCCRCCFVQLSCLTCCQYGGREAVVGDLTDFSLIMKNYMDTGGYLDVTPTDILAAIYCLKRLHVQEHLEAKEKFMEIEEQRKKEASLQLSSLMKDESSEMDMFGRSELTSEKGSEGQILFGASVEGSKGFVTSPVADKKLSAVVEGDETEDPASSALLEEPLEENIKDAAVEEPKTAHRQASILSTDDSPRPSAENSRHSITLADLQSYRQSRRTLQDSKKAAPWTAPEKTIVFRPMNARHRLGFTNKFSIVQSFRAEVRGSLDPELNGKERFILAEAARFIHSAEAIYTWSMWPTKKGRDRVGLTYMARKIDERHPEFVEWITDVKTWLKVAPIPGISPKDVVYASFRKSLTETPYCVLIDHAWKSVVITIRGSMSLEDMLTDLTMIPSELREIGDRLGFQGGNRFCHRGILARVEWIYNDLMSKSILDTVFGATDDIHTPEAGATTNPVHQYRLRVCGHSLGAGCAAILSLLLKTKYPRVRCIAFSPPGCSVSEALAEDMESYVTSHILDTDVVGRTTIGGITQLRDELLQVIARIQIPKHFVLGARKGKYKGMDLKTFNQAAMASEDDIPPSKYLDEVMTFFDYQKGIRDGAKELFEIDLFPPGKIVQYFRTVHLQPGGGGLCGCGGDIPMEDEADTDQAYTARWAKKEDFARVVLSSHFLSDHETANVKGQIHLLANESGIEEPFNSVLDLEP